jgi:multisubunit Na+/H+ antiporter MnhE subunit
MAQVAGPLAGAGGAPRSREPVPASRRVCSWLIWWVLLMALWVWVDDTLLAAELAVGAGVAALGAGLAELAQYQASSRIRIRSDWLGKAVTLPWQVGRDTVVVLSALARQLLLGREPESGFEEIPVSWGDDSDEGVTRRALLIGATSLAPNTFALGIDRERETMFVHRLVTDARRGGAASDD